MTQAQSICGAEYPSEDPAEQGLTCARPPGTNAYNDDRDENVHVHWARRELDGAIFRWQDMEPVA